MGETTKIEWTEYTGSPWYVCTQVSEACKNCYAMILSRGRMKKITGGRWNAGARRVASKSLRENALKWNKKSLAAILADWEQKRSKGPVAAGPAFVAWLEDQPKMRKPTVFPSLCDPWDAEVPVEWMVDFLQVILETPWLNWLLLTKRPQLILGRLNEAKAWALQSVASETKAEGVTSKICLANWLQLWLSGSPPDNVSLGVTAENQRRADERREAFREVPARRKFVSYEPALGPVDWTGWEFVDQIISGGESSYARTRGADTSRPSHPAWHLATRDWCQANKVAFFFKQWGNWVPVECEPDDGGRLILLPDRETFRGSLSALRLLPGPSPAEFEGAQMMSWRPKHLSGAILDGREWKEALPA